MLDNHFMYEADCWKKWKGWVRVISWVFIVLMLNSPHLFATVLPQQALRVDRVLHVGHKGENDETKEQHGEEHQPKKDGTFFYGFDVEVEVLPLDVAGEGRACNADVI